MTVIKADVGHVGTGSLYKVRFVHGIGKVD